MKLKMEAMEWDARVRGYRETIQKCVVLFRKVLINKFGNHEESDQLKVMRGNMACCTRTLAKNGFMLGICEDFIELIQEVKKEPRSPPPSPNRGQGMKEVSEDGSSSQKTVEKAQEDDVMGKSPSAEKPEEAESADKEGEGSSSSNSTPQKKQVVCMATATKNTNTDTEKATSPEKSSEGDASKGKKSKKTLGTHVSKRVLWPKKTK